MLKVLTALLLMLLSSQIFSSESLEITREIEDMSEEELECEVRDMARQFLADDRASH